MELRPGMLSWLCLMAVQCDGCKEGACCDGERAAGGCAADASCPHHACLLPPFLIRLHLHQPEVLWTEVEGHHDAPAGQELSSSGALAGRCGLRRLPPHEHVCIQSCGREVCPPSSSVPHLPDGALPLLITIIMCSGCAASSPRRGLTFLTTRGRPMPTPQVGNGGWAS